MWTIFFHRLFGPITPTTHEFLDITYPMVADQPELDATIDQNIDHLIKKYLGHQSAPLEGVLLVQFLDENQAKAKKKSGWFGQITDGRNDLVPWETWRIFVQCAPLASPEHLASLTDNTKAFLRPSLASFEQCLEQITSYVDRHKDHIPPIMTLDVAPFPYKMEVLANAQGARTGEDESWSHYIKKMMD